MEHVKCVVAAVFPLQYSNKGMAVFQKQGGIKVFQLPAVISPCYHHTGISPNPTTQPIINWL